MDIKDEGNHLEPIKGHLGQAFILQEMRKLAAIAHYTPYIESAKPYANDGLTMDKDRKDRKGRKDRIHGSFLSVLEEAIDSVDALQHVASQKQEAIDMGLSDDLTGTMIANEKASIAFSATHKVSEKLLTAITETMNTSL